MFLTGNLNKEWYKTKTRRKGEKTITSLAEFAIPCSLNL